MSKGNLFLGMASGKIGSVVLYRAFGQERARSWLASKKNPRTWRQGLQRCMMKTAQVAYSALLPFCRDAFQGFEPGTPSQAAFTSRNVRLLRSRVADDIAAGRSACLESAVGCFNGRGDEIMLANPLMVSDGSLGTLGAVVTDFQLWLDFAAVAVEGPTYAQVCSAFGFQKGDVLRLLFLGFRSGALVAVSVGRLVLEPSSGDMSAPFILDGDLNLPNEGNSGNWGVEVTQEGFLCFTCPSVAPNAGAVVLERKFGSLRQFSAEYVSFDGQVVSGWPLGTALASYLEGGDVYLDGLG